MSDHDAMSRRSFLAQSVVAGAVGLAGMETELIAGKKRRRRKKKKDKRSSKQLTVFDLDHVHFEDLIGKTFDVEGSPHSQTQHHADLILIDVSTHENESDDDRPEHIRDFAYSLLFVARDGEEIEDGTHTVKCCDLGCFDLFLHETVSFSQPHHKHYVAVFN